MRPLVGLFLFLFLGAGCVFVTTDTQPDPAHADNAIVLFLTGNELGWLKPCGCSGGQLGGLNRRAAILESVTRSQRLIIETGNLIPEISEQMLIKFDIFMQAFQILGYDLVNLTAQDLEVIQQLGLLEELKGQISLTTSQRLSGVDLPDTFLRTFSISGRGIEIQVKTMEREGFDADSVESLFGDAQLENPVKILIINGADEVFVKSLAGRSIPVDCIVCPIDMEEPEVLSGPDSPCLLISVGKKGRYVGKLVLTFDARREHPKLSFSKQAVSEDLPYNDEMVRLYATYQDIVKASNLLATFRRVPLDSGLTYVGSGECEACHEEAYGIWKGKQHAHAYATLERVGSQYDPECVLCHVVGLEYESGFVSEEETDSLKDVGCEVCHGPGSEHVKTYGEAKTVEPRKRCLDCHTPEHSAGYGGHEQEFLEKIRHWREPKGSGHVKER
jgi:hypothetical protein